MHAQTQLFQVIDALGRTASRADCTAGKSSAIKTAMIAITTKSSINVNAERKTQVDLPSSHNPSVNETELRARRERIPILKYPGAHGRPQVRPGSSSRSAPRGGPGASLAADRASAASRSPGHSARYGTPELIGFGVIAPFGGQDRQVAPGQMSVDPLIDAAKLLGAPDGRDPSPAPIRPRSTRPGGGGPAARRNRSSASSGSSASPSAQTCTATALSPSIWWHRAIRANSFRVMESLVAEPARLFRNNGIAGAATPDARWRWSPG